MKRRRPTLGRDQARALLAVVEDPPPFPGVSGRQATVFERNACQHCGGIHTRNCPAVEEIEYFPDGKVQRVRFRAWWDDSRVLWLDDVYEAARLGDG